MPARSAKSPKPASGVDPDVYARALSLRASITGPEYSNRADTGLDPSLLAARELLTEWVWGKVWMRKRIPHHVRSFMNIGLLMALNRPNEFKLQVRMALNNGLAREDVGEAILHAAAYCGVPAGVSAINMAEEVFRAIDAERAPPAPSTARAGARGKKR